MMDPNSKPAQRIHIWLPLLLSASLVAGMFAGMKLEKSEPTLTYNPDLDGPGQGTIEEMLRYIDSRYVDSVNRSEIQEDAIKGLLSHLDPHSAYIPASELNAINEDLEGNFEGIGVEYMIIRDTLTIISPVSGGPAEHAGIIAGDKIITIADSAIAGKKMEVRQIAARLKGPKGTQVRIGVLRGQDKELRQFTITRDVIPVQSVEVSYMLDEHTGYIKISRFSATTYQEFMNGLENLVEKKGMKHLVIDLRQNPGGYLKEATNILSQLFAEKDKLLVYTQGRSAHRTQYETSGRALFKVDKLAVLIDEGSASASEIIAGAVQDWDRGVIIGRRSFGKGLVQEQYQLKDGSALRLTVARYYIPSGRCIQRPYLDKKDYEKDLQHRLEDGELVDERIHVKYSPDTAKYYTASGRLVKGGGGITPDIFIPLDTVLNGLVLHHYRDDMTNFVIQYANSHKNALPATSDQFNQQFQVTDALFKEFLAYSEKDNPRAGQRLNNNQISELKLLLKARIARHLFQNEGFYRVWNNHDDAVRRALEALKRQNPLAGLKK